MLCMLKAARLSGPRAHGLREVGAQALLRSPSSADFISAGSDCSTRAGRTASRGLVIEYAAHIHTSQSVVRLSILQKHRLFQLKKKKKTNIYLCILFESRATERGGREARIDPLSAGLLSGWPRQPALDQPRAGARSGVGSH